MFRTLIAALILLLPLAVYSDDITVLDKDRQSITLESIIPAGKWTLVNFWALDCSICLVEKPKIAEFARQRNDLQVIGLALDGWDSRFDVEGYLDEHKVDYLNFVVDPKSIYDEYSKFAGRSLRGTPTFLLFDKDKKLVAINAGRLYIENLRNFIDKQS